MRSVLVCAAALAAFAGSARAQTMLDQEVRLIEIHSLLIDIPPGAAPGAYRPGEVSLGLEVIGIPSINGQTGGKVQITASDHTPLFPRPRLAVGLPAPDGPFAPADGVSRWITSRARRPTASTSSRKVHAGPSRTITRSCDGMISTYWPCAPRARNVSAGMPAAMR